MENLKLLVTSLCRIANIGGEVLEDGKIDWKDVGDLLPIGQVVEDLQKVDYTKLTSEILAMDEAKAAELVEHVKTTLNLPQEDAEQRVEKAVSLIVESYLTVKRIVKAVKELLETA